MTSNLNEDEFYNVKENLLLKNFLENSRKEKAKVLRLQQVHSYEEWLNEHLASTLTQCSQSKTALVTFVPESLIQDAIKEGNKYEVLDLLSNGLSVNFNKTQGEGMTLLHQACIYDDYIIAQALIKKGAYLNLQDDYGCTPLHLCCMWDSLKCAQLLVSNNASVNVLDVDGNFAVDLAPDNSHLKAMMKKHMQQKLKIDESQLNSLRNKTQKKMLQDIRHLLEEGGSVDLTNSAGISLLHIAVTNGYVTAARMLLENSANANAVDYQMWTPLHCAAKYGQVKMTRLLLSHYANPHAHTITGFTPRELTKNPEIRNMLLEAEDTFLDLDNQKTPSKPKRFSASLLDKDDDEVDIIRVASRTITASKISKRAIFKEKELAMKIADELRQEFKSEIEFSPPNISNSAFVISSWHHAIPPPVPPRDDIPSVSSFFQTVKQPKTELLANTMYDDTSLKAVITIQRAYRHHLKFSNQSKLDIALCTLEDYGNSFYEEMVFQNAEDIARENDRQRSRKNQRNSWSNDQRRSVRSSTSNRPLSTGTLLMQMHNAPNQSVVWLPQSNHTHSMPPDVIPQNSPENKYWTGQKDKSRRLYKNLSVTSADSGVSLNSNKDHIELTKTVKHSLKISDNPDFQSFTRQASLPVRRSPAQPSYRMPPLTPTVASLINTAAHSKTTPPSSAKGGSKKMQPVASQIDDYSENVYLDPIDLNIHKRFRSQTTREHSLMSNRGTILKDARFRTLTHPDPAATNRHSWNGEQEESSTSFGRSSMQSVTPITPSASSEGQTFAYTIDSVSEIPSTTTSAKSSKRNSRNGGPPPLPRRAPTTKLSKANDAERPHVRANSLGQFHPGSQTSFYNHFENNRNSAQNSLETGQDSSPDDNLPVVPPPLPLYKPHVHTSKNNDSEPSVFENDFPAPPPMLLYDTPLNNSALTSQKNLEIVESIYDFPRPPPL